eukprot:TRINITY_DN16485_c0_g1_i1.p1 TRINITY_DN16485_c0_g1~~TRINITY_DN16485_c0_g1_i1.p1  ORF type:complete len:175 (-),score=59.96 TRINITY_DN16485_c0_g1_i1:69-593(-)
MSWGDDDDRAGAGTPWSQAQLFMIACMIVLPGWLMLSWKQKQDKLKQQEEAMNALRNAACGSDKDLFKIHLENAKKTGVEAHIIVELEADFKKKLAEAMLERVDKETDNPRLLDDAIKKAREDHADPDLLQKVRKRANVILTKQEADLRKAMRDNDEAGIQKLVRLAQSWKEEM